jgi:glutamine synthetase
VCLAAGLEGIQKKWKAPKQTDFNLYDMSEKQVEELKLERLPVNLGEALDALEEDTFICDVLGEHLVSKYVEAKRKEWKEYCVQVTDWEIQQYLRTF